VETYLFDFLGIFETKRLFVFCGKAEIILHFLKNRSIYLSFKKGMWKKGNKKRKRYDKIYFQC
jgi:hypothetical protein